MQRLWNNIVVALLWPVWWTLAGLYLVFSAVNSVLPSVPVGNRVRAAMHMFQIWLGWRDLP